MAEIPERGGPWFHGGVAGLDVGDLLLPGAAVGASTERAVSVTHYLDVATSYAAFWRGGGDIYEVAVEHPTIPPLEEEAAAALSSATPCWPPVGPFHFTVRSAAVVRVVRRCVPNPLAPPFDAARRRKPIKRRRANA